MATTMNAPAAAAKARIRTRVKRYGEQLPAGLYSAIAADDEDVEMLDRVQNERSKSRRAVVPQLRRAKEVATQQALATEDMPNPTRESIAAAARESANGMVADKASPVATEDVLGMQKKKKQRLLEKMKTGRPAVEVMKSAPVGSAALTSAPKLSDFKDGTVEQRIRNHAAAMQKFSQNNLTSKAIEYETRVRAGCFLEHTQWGESLMR